MLDLIVSLIKDSSLFYTFLGGIVTGVVYFLVKSKAREEVKNEILQENVQHVTQQSEKVATIQQKQVKIAAEPTPDRDDLYNQLFNLNQQDKKSQSSLDVQ